jgi:hypothetical protein
MPRARYTEHLSIFFPPIFFLAARELERERDATLEQFRACEMARFQDAHEAAQLLHAVKARSTQAVLHRVATTAAHVLQYIIIIIIYTYIHTYIHTYIYNICIYICVCIYIYMYVCMCVCVCAYIYVCIYILAALLSLYEHTL